MGLLAEYHNVGRLFWHSIRLKKKSPIFHTNPSHEVDAPYRWSKSLIVRLPWATRGLVIGWWRDTTRTEEDAILAAMGGPQKGRDMTYDELLEELLCDGLEDAPSAKTS